MEGTWWSLLPFLLIIPLAVWLKEILPGLVAGLLVGAFCLEWSAVGAIERAVSAVLHALTDPEHMKVAAFLYLFGSLVGMMQITGGIKGFVERLSGRIRSKRGILLFVWLTVPVTFFMPMFRIMLLGPVMKAVLRQFRIDRRRMAYMIDVSTEPIIVLLPAATAFVGFMTSVVAAALEQNDIHESPYDVFLRSLPYNLFAIVALAVGVLTTMLNIRIGKPRAKKGEGETNTLHGLGLRKELALINGEPLHLFVPLALLIALTFAFFVYDGRKRGAENWWEAFSAADATWAMLLA
ncbi:sodium:proton antiporter, partial [Geobacillus zalihae]